MTTKILLISLTLFLTACGTLTGIPSHGGGKRFAVEQELVTASARAAIKNMDLHNLQGRRVALYVSTMGDQGSGTLTGGRYSVSALLRGEYTNIPGTLTSYAYPNYTTTADTLSSNTQSTSVLNSPSRVRSKTGGASSTSNIGLNINGQGDYRNETLIPKTPPFSTASSKPSSSYAA